MVQGTKYKLSVQYLCIMHHALCIMHDPSYHILAHQRKCHATLRLPERTSPVVVSVSTCLMFYGQETKQRQMHTVHLRDDAHPMSSMMMQITRFRRLCASGLSPQITTLQTSSTLQRNAHLKRFLSDKLTTGQSVPTKEKGNICACNFASQAACHNAHPGAETKRYTSLGLPDRP